MARYQVFLCIGFVFVGLVYALCDRWQRQLVVQGVRTRKPHNFDHPFLMWLLKQFVQLGFLVMWKAVEGNWLFCHRLQNAQNRRGRPLARNVNMANYAEVNPQEGPVGIEEPLIQNEDERHENVAVENNVNVQEEELKKQRNNKQPSKLMYFPPAFFAQAHALLLCFGLKLTYSSSFIMLKGTVAFFTALLSLAFLAQQLAFYIWFGVVVATIGFAVSGISDYIQIPGGGYEKYGIAAGDLLILMAQIMFATKIIYEEKFIHKYSIQPAQFLGCEAIYGTVFAVIFFLVFNLVDAVQYSYLPNGRLEDVVDAAIQFSNSWKIILSVLGSLVSYALYAYLGMALIRDLGALHRIMIETFIWGIYWAICLGLHWENFYIAQVPGLVVIAIGSLIYSGRLIMPSFCFRENPAEPDPQHYINQQNEGDNQPAPGIGDFGAAQDLMQGQDLTAGDDVHLIQA